MIDVETIFDSDREEYEFMQEKKEQPMKEQIEEMANEIMTVVMRNKNMLAVAETLYNAGYRKQSEVIDDIIAILHGEADAEEKLETQAWCENDTEGYHMHRYTKEKLDALITAISAMKDGE